MVATRDSKYMTVFEKVEHFRKIMSPLVEDKSDDEIRIILSHLRSFRVGRLQKLSEEESKIYSFMLQNNLNPKTCYKHFVLLNAPDHITQMLKENKISMENAQSRARLYRRKLDLKAGREIIEDVREVVRRLRWRALEHIQNHK